MRIRLRGLLAFSLLTVLGAACSNEEGGISLPEDLEAIRAAAEAGDLEAQFRIGMIYEDGIGVESDEAEAVPWLLKAAEAGHVEAQIEVGRFYWEGDGVEKDLEEAKKWFLSAAKEGSATAQFNLGALYYREEPDEAGLNYSEAARWFRAAAAQGEPDALYSLGLMHELGDGVTQDYGKAMEFYSRAADAGNVDGIYGVGSLYEQGLGVEQDFAEAIEWYLEAAEHWDGGLADAQNDLAWIYATCREEDLRDGRRAAKYALMANADDPDNPYFKDTLAAAYARNGWFEDAMAAQQRAIDMIEADGELTGDERAETLEDFRSRMEEYRRGEAHVDTDG